MRGLKGEKDMIKLEHVPHGYKEIVEYYGNPDPQGDGNLDPEFWNKYMKKFTLPYPMRIGWEPQKEDGSDNTVERIWAHEKVGDSLVDALNEIGTYMSGDPAYLRRNDLDFYWGCFAFRFQRGANIYSTHSWGIAFDLNKHLGELGEEPEMPEYIVNAFKKRNWVWGGDFERSDGMHFQAARGY